MLIIVKAGGKVLKNNLSEIAANIKNIINNNENQVVFVHGGGIEVTLIAEKLGEKQMFVTSPEGFRSRYTDKNTIKIYNMVMSGKINKDVVCVFQGCGIPCIGISGADGLLLKAKKKEKMIIVDERGRKRVVDAGFTGKIRKVNAELLKLLIKNGYVPVISPVAISEEFELLNVDSDRVAAVIAGTLQADKLVYLTDVQGVMLNGKILKKLKLSEIKTVLSRIGAGMSTKIHAAAEALKLGAKEVIIASGMQKVPISSTINRESGTVMTHE